MLGWLVLDFSGLELVWLLLNELVVWILGLLVVLCLFVCNLVVSFRFGMPLL